MCKKLFGLVALICGFGLTIFLDHAAAFSLSGPIEPWMQVTNGVLTPLDTTGPKQLGNGYRWNVPVVTYGFDQSFLNYFGSNGVAVVEDAVKLLNDLPPASQIVLTNYSYFTAGFNALAGSKGLCDLKSYTLSLLLGQMGLAAPVRNIYLLQSWDPADLNLDRYHPVSGWYIISWLLDDSFAPYVVQRNFDPQTYAATPYVNEILYGGNIISWASSTPVPNDWGIANYILSFPVDPRDSMFTAVADLGINTGEYYVGLTYDDVGGLRYLLSSNNICYETLLPDVQLYVTNAVPSDHRKDRKPPIRVLIQNCQSFNRLPQILLLTVHGVQELRKSLLSCSRALLPAFFCR